MIHFIHEFVWGPGMLILFLAVGILYTLRLSFFPLIGIGRWWKNTVGSVFAKKSIEGEGVTQFQSACTALAATIGTGNIAGVATALLAGGPGAVFWMWASAFLGMATAYGETYLGIKYRKRDQNGQWMSGPMLYLENGIKSRLAGILYALLCITASFGMGSMVQANAISETLHYTFSLPSAAIGMILTCLAGCIIAGGVRRIGEAAEKMVPLSAGIYMAASLAVIFLFRRNLPAAIGIIFEDAFSFRSAAGGAAGYGISRCIRYGIARGVFSNEAGLGSMAILNGAAEDAESHAQGQWAIFEVFFDTIVSCTVTAFVILCTMGGDLERFTGNGAALTNHCFSMGIGNLGGYVVALCTVLFAFATIIAWYYMGKQSAAYLGEKSGREERITRLYFFGYLTAVFIGSLGPMEIVWEVSDIFNAMMAVPNLLALIILVGQVKKP